MGFELSASIGFGVLLNQKLPECQAKESKRSDLGLSKGGWRAALGCWRVLCPGLIFAGVLSGSVVAGPPEGTW